LNVLVQIRVLVVLVIGGLLFANISIPTTNATTIIVPDDYADIQTAINRASPGDVITIRAGVYGGFKVSKSLVIIGESNQSVIIKGSVEISANNVRLGSLKILVDESVGSTRALVIIGNNTVLTGIVVESFKDGVQLGSMSQSVSGTVIEYSKVIAGRIGIYGVYEDLGVFYSEVIVSSGNALIGGHYLDVEYSIITGDTAVSSGLFSSGWIIKNNHIIGSSTGIYLDGTYHTVSNNVINGNTGIIVKGKGITIENNTISASETGVLLTSHNNVVVGNKISAAKRAIDLNGNGNLIINNTLMGGRGVHASGAYGNTIAFNLINMTGSVGVYFSKYTSDNLVYGNTFWYCYNYEAADESGGNQWYLENETHKLGNYWSYNKALDNNGDGITDSPYPIPTTTGLEILDKYPLAQPLVSPYQTPSPTTSPPETTTPTLPPYITGTTTTSTSTQTTTPSPGFSTDTTTQGVGGEAGSLYVIGSVVLVVFILIVAFILLRRR